MGFYIPEDDDLHSAEGKMGNAFEPSKTDVKFCPPPP
jgi:hypothetical protein